MDCPYLWMSTKDNNFLLNSGRYKTSCRRKSGRPRNLSLMVPSPDGLSFDLSANYTAPSTFLVNSSKKYLLKVMWKVAPKVINQAYFHVASEALNNFSVTPMLQYATT